MSDKLSVVTPTRGAVTLDDGSYLGPGETAEVDADLPHNRNLIIDENVAVISGPHPRVRHNDQLVADETEENN